MSVLELWGMQSISSLPSLPGWLWSEVVATELFEIELFWHLTVCKQDLYLTELFELELFD